MAVIRSEYFSQTMVGFRSFTAVLPIDLPPADGARRCYVPGPWPTLDLLHGYAGGRNDWLRNSPIEELAVRYGLAVIMPDGDNSFYLDNPETGVYCGEMIGRELVEVTRGMFNLSHKRGDTLIGGLSMGGFGAIRNGLKYRDTFSTILAFSSALILNQYISGECEKHPAMGTPATYYRCTFGPKEEARGSDKDPEALAEAALKDGNAPDLFLACGSEDFLFAANTEFHEFLDRKSYPHTWWVEPGIHNFDFWNRAVTAGLAWWNEKRQPAKEGI